MIQLKPSTKARENMKKKKQENKPETIDSQIWDSTKISSTGSLLKLPSVATYELDCTFIYSDKHLLIISKAKKMKYS